MRTVLIANSKGGCGKTTMATNIAGYLAAQGKHVVLSDMDRQQSAIRWLHQRSQTLPHIFGIDGRIKRESSGGDWTVIDSPAGLHGEKLTDAIKQSDLVIVPMQPSAFDFTATDEFLNVLREEKAIRKERAFVAMVGTRVNERSRTMHDLNFFLQETGFPVLTCLRNAQVYMEAAKQGVSLFDLKSPELARDLDQWAPILSWLETI